MNNRIYIEVAEIIITKNEIIINTLKKIKENYNMLGENLEITISENNKIIKIKFNEVEWLNICDNWGRRSKGELIDDLTLLDRLESPEIVRERKKTYLKDGWYTYKERIPREIISNKIFTIKY